MTFASRVAVVGPSGHLMHRVSGSDAATLLLDGASVFSKRAGVVSAILLSAGQQVRGGADHLRPGSFGIKRESPRKHDALLLSAGKLYPPLPNHCAIAVW